MAGRPPLPKSKRRTDGVFVPLTEAEKGQIRGEAERRGKPMAEFLRDAGLREAKKAKP